MLLLSLIKLLTIKLINSLTMDLEAESLMEIARKLLQKAEFVSLVGEILIKPAVTEALDSKIEEANKKIDGLSEKLLSVTEKLGAAERRIQQLEAYSRRNCLTISGVPEHEAEDTDQLVLDIAKSAGVILSPDDIDVSHRLGRKGAKPRSLIAKFVTRNVREKLYNSRRDKTVSRVRHHPVLTEDVLRSTYISECLTPQTQQLLFVCRQLKREQRLWAAYTTNGRVKIKMAEDQAPKFIDSMEQIEEMAGEQWVRDVLESPRRDNPPAGQSQGRSGGTSRVPVPTGNRRQGGGRADQRRQPSRGSR